MPVDTVIILLFGTFSVVFAAVAIGAFYTYKKTKDALFDSRTQVDTLNQQIVLLRQRLTTQPAQRTDPTALITKAVLQTINQAVIVINKAGTVIYINPYAELHLGRRREEVIGKPYRVVFRLVDESEQSDDSFINDALQKNVAISNKLTFLYQLTGKLPIICVAIPLSSADGVEGACFAFADATEQYAKERALQQKNAELAKESQRLLDALQTQKKENELAVQLFEGIQTGIIVLDHEGKLLSINPAAEKITGAYKSTALGQLFSQVLILTSREGKLSYGTIENALRGSGGIFEKWTFITSKNEKIPILGSASPLLTGNSTLKILVTLSDATDEFAREEEEKAFFSAAAHDLRTPLTTLRTILELITRSSESMTKEKFMEMIANANASLMQLINLVNDLLSVSRIEQGRLEIKKEVFDLVALTDTVIKDSLVLAKEKKLYVNHKIEDVTSAKVTADKSKTQEVLTNLVSNAVKYTHQGGVTVSHRIEGNMVYTIVEDTGTGISPEHKGLLFRKFQQIGTARLQHIAKSTGLGLYITKKFLQLMGGDISLVSSEPGKGSTFQFSLPLSQEGAQQM